MYGRLKEVNAKPKVFGAYTAQELWNDPYTSRQMLKYHLNPDISIASRTNAFIDRSVVWIRKYFSVQNDTSICDFGCGPGLYTSRLASISNDITGLDFSESSINYAISYAKNNNLNIDYKLCNYLEFGSNKRFDIIMMIMCDFCALSPRQRSKMFKIFSQHLKDSGMILLDVYSLNAYDAREEQAVYEHNQLNKFWSSIDYYAFVNTFKYDEEKVVLDKYTIFEENGKEKVVLNWLQYFDQNSLKNELNNYGFEIVEYFSNVAGEKFSEINSEFAVVLKKK